jgi:uncharacterized membrane protein
MAPQMPMMAPQRTSGMAIAGFVLSFFCSVLGLIFSIMGRKEVARSNGTVGGGGLALAGIIISIISLVLGVFYAIFIVIFVSRGVTETKRIMEEQRVEAVHAADQAVKQADEATAKVEAVARELADLDKQIQDAQAAVNDAKTAAARDAAEQRLKALQQQQVEAQARAAAAAEAAAAAQRAKGVHVDPKCMDNPLAPGC